MMKNCLSTVPQSSQKACPDT